jgi:glycosyltransferase involved in cell wall biosynthesis
LNSKIPTLLIADVPGWIFERHCNALKQLLSDEFDITVRFQNEPFRERDYQLIYPLEWYMLEPIDIEHKEKYITGIRSHLIWPDLKFSSFVQRLNDNFNNIHVVSQRLFDIFAPYIPNLSYTTHGVDTDFFHPSTIAGNSDDPVKIGWAGNRKSIGNKGFEDIIAPLGRLKSVELVFCGYSDKNLTIAEMKKFYDSIDVYVCASENFEGNNNSLMEAAAMARAIVTTDNGTVPEYLEHQKSALIVNRDFKSFKNAVLRLVENRQTIAHLGSNAQRVIRSEWDWRIKAEEYRKFFHEALKRQNESI